MKDLLDIAHVATICCMGPNGSNGLHEMSAHRYECAIGVLPDLSGTYPSPSSYW